VLVTGGAGFIGARVVSGLLGRGCAVVVLDDLSGGRRERLAAEHPRLRVVIGDARSALLARELAAGPFDALLHLAGCVGVRRVLDDPEECRRSTLALSTALVRALEELAPLARPRVLAASSSEVYRESRAPVAEDAPLRSLDGVGRWAYAGAKLAAERVLDDAAGLWPAGRGPVHLRFFNVVGPGQDSASGMVLPTFVERARAGLALPVHGDGQQVRTLAHVDDVARDLVRLLCDVAAPAGPLNLGGTTRCTVGELARTVARLAGRGPEALCSVDPRRTLSAAFEEVRHREPCLQKAAALGLRLSRRSLEELVQDTMSRHAATLSRPAPEAAAAASQGSSACASPAS
jgi:UDP-glucose 4-epimerase